MRTIFILVLTIGLAPAEAVAQYPVQSFSDLRAMLKPGQRVIVDEQSGRKSRGAVISLDDDALDLKWRNWYFQRRERSFAEASVRSIKISDSTLDGELIGLGIGIGLGTLVETRCDSESCLERGIAALVFGPPLGLVLGLAIDGARNRMVYQSRQKYRVRFTPLVGPRQVGAAARIAF